MLCFSRKNTVRQIWMRGKLQEPPGILLVTPVHVAFFSFYVTQHHEHPAGTGCLGWRRMVKAGGLGGMKEDAGSIPLCHSWGHWLLHNGGGVFPQLCPSSLTWNTLTASTGQGNCPWTLASPMNVPSGANLSNTVSPSSLKEPLWAVGATSGCPLDGKSQMQPQVTQSQPWAGKESCTQVVRKKEGKSPKGKTSLPPGSDLCRRFSRFHFRNNQPLIIKSMLLGKWSQIKGDQRQERKQRLYKYLPILYRVL